MYWTIFCLLTGVVLGASGYYKFTQKTKLDPLDDFIPLEELRTQHEYLFNYYTGLVSSSINQSKFKKKSY
jgi:hypothetical protein